LDTAELYKLALNFLKIAQKLFGPKVEGWTFTGVEIKDKGPNLEYYPETGNITIVLSEKVIEDKIQLVFQLSHEAYHLLHPSRDFETNTLYPTTVFNEGLSTYFQVMMTSYQADEKFLLKDLKDNSPNYYNAFKLVENILNQDNLIVQKLRKQEPNIDRLLHDHFKKVKANTPKEIIEELLKPF